jgi:YHS domain-containing protein
MIRNIFIFLGTFVAGALIALVARAALFKPEAGQPAAPAPKADYAPMVSNALTPAPAPDPHVGHSATTAATTRAAAKPVNTVCAICGMAVDPKMPTMEYQGKTIGFGCKLCAPKFKADPDRYGPAYLRNEVIKK